MATDAMKVQLVRLCSCFWTRSMACFISPEARP